MSRRSELLAMLALVAAGMLCYPPWVADGYGWLFDPPERASVIDFNRLWLQLAAVALAAVAVLTSVQGSASSRPGESAHRQ